MAQLLNLTILLFAAGLVTGARKQQTKKPPVEEELDAETSKQCPEPYGYFADPEQCDKYYECSDSQITENLCPDGMVFNDFSSEYEKCDLPFNIDCTQRPKLQTPQPTEHCPRKHGYFSLEEKNVCNKFYYCVDGKFNIITCPDGLVYSEKTGNCTWPDEAEKKGCSSKEVFQFDCPKVNESYAITHPRYLDPEDCQFFYVCINGDTPCRNGLVTGARKQQTEKPPVEEELDAETSEQCPEPYGYFADAEQCDKYYECRDSQITEKLCPDGMVFNDFSSEYEKCDLPFNIDCTQRPKLQTPQPTEHCPRKHGYFSHEEKNVCDKFYYCVDGKFSMITCHDGLVYNEKIGICAWPDELEKKGCSSKEVFQFDCPKVNESYAITHPRYSDPEDCQFFYVCINGDIPRRNSCKLGQAFDDRSKKCDWARKIPECADWYKGQLTDEQLDALEHPHTSRPKSNNPINRRRPSRKQQRAEENDD